MFCSQPEWNIFSKGYLMGPRLPMSAGGKKNITLLSFQMFRVSLFHSPLDFSVKGNDFIFIETLYDISYGLRTMVNPTLCWSSRIFKPHERCDFCHNLVVHGIPNDIWPFYLECWLIFSGWFRRSPIILNISKYFLFIVGYAPCLVMWKSYSHLLVWIHQSR